jgi:membrane protease YdiL (CAAX protease family)
MFHGSLYRLVPTGVLGLMLGYLRVTSKSLWPGVIVHAMTNTILILVSKVAPRGAQEELTGPTPWMLLGLALVALGWTLIGKRFSGARSRAPR